LAQLLRCRHPQALKLALGACVLAFIAERRAARRVLIISTRPSPLLGTPEASPASTARAARSASEGSDFSTLRRELRRWRLGRSTSSTSMLLALRWRSSLRARRSWCLLPRRISRDRNPPPSTGASRNPSRSLARSIRQGFSVQMVHGHSRVEVQVRVYTQDHRNLRVRPFGADRPHVRKLLSMSRSLRPEEQERTDECAVRGHVRGELL
jgi:hypothetical protein